MAVKTRGIDPVNQRSNCEVQLIFQRTVCPLLRVLYLSATGRRQERLGPRSGAPWRSRKPAKPPMRIAVLPHWRPQPLFCRAHGQTSSFVKSGMRENGPALYISKVNHNTPL